MATLHIVRGIPGSGKSTFAKKAFNGALLLENDMWFVRDGKYKWSAGVELFKAIRWCKSAAEEALARGMDVVVANTFTKREFVQHYVDLAESLGATWDVWRCVGDYGSVHGLPALAMQSFRDGMEDWPGEKIVKQNQ